MSRLRVLCCWDISICPDALDGLKEVADVDVIEPDREKFLEIIGEYDAYLASLKIQIDREVLDRASKLKIIYTPSTGLDHLDLDTMKEKGIEMRCIKTEFGLLDRVTATAEMAWTLMLSAMRRLPSAHNAAMRGEWARDQYRGNQMSEKTLGIIGVGRLGRMVAEYGQGFRMNVLGYDRSKRFIVPGVNYVDLDTLLAESDIISIHIHLSDENRHFIDKAKFDKMKDGVIIVNTSRGAIINEDDFVEAIKSGKVGGAGLDVIEGEWRDDLENHPLIQLAREHGRIVISPHLGGVTYESQSMAMQFVADRLGDWIKENT